MHVSQVDRRLLSLGERYAWSDDDGIPHAAGIPVAPPSSPCGEQELH